MKTIWLLALLFWFACGSESDSPTATETVWVCSEEGHFIDSRPVPTEVRTRVVSSRVLILEVRTDDGNPAWSAPDCKDTLQQEIGPFWDWHFPTDYSDVTADSFYCPGIIPVGTGSGQYYITTDWVEQNVLYPYLDSMGWTTQDFRHMILLLPPKNYPFEGVGSYYVAVLNTQTTRKKAILTHELGHGYSLGHSRSRLYNNCVYQGINEYGGDDIMGNALWRRLNPYHLNIKNILVPIAPPTPLAEQKQIWVQPLDNFKTALKIDNKYFYYREQQEKWFYVEGSQRKQAITPYGGEIAKLNLTILREGRTDHSGTYEVLICTSTAVWMKTTVTVGSNGYVELLVPDDVDIWVRADYPQWLARTIHIVANTLPNNPNRPLQIKCGDTNNDEQVMYADLSPGYDVNGDEQIDGFDITLIQRNLGSTSTAVTCSSYITDGTTKYEVQGVATYGTFEESGFNPEDFFPEATGVRTPNSLLFLIKQTTQCQ